MDENEQEKEPAIAIEGEHSSETEEAFQKDYWWIEELELKEYHRYILQNRKAVDDTIIRAAMILARKINNQICGLLPTILIKTLDYAIDSWTFLQILQARPFQCVFLYSLHPERKDNVFLLDSLGSSPNESITEQVASLLRTQ